MSDRVEITYRGKTYYRLADLARDYGISTRLVSYRWHSGHRNPAELVTKGRLNTNSGNHIIVYKGHLFKSAKAFCRKYNLNYPKVLKAMKKGITDPDQLINIGSTLKDALTEMLSDDKADEDAKTKLINSKNLLTIKQVAAATGVSSEQLNSTIHHLLKKGHTVDTIIGLKFDDIVQVTIDQNHAKKVVKNETYVVNYGLKRIAVKHILNRIHIIDIKNMKQLPDPYSKYYYNPNDHTVWRYSAAKGKVGTIKSSLQQKEKHYAFELFCKDDYAKKHYLRWTVAEVEDLLQHPEITANSLITTADIGEKYGLSPVRISARGIVKVLPFRHVRFSRKTGKKVVGWTDGELNKAVNMYPNKFAPVQSKYGK